jgi:hypothetical protein
MNIFEMHHVVSSFEEQDNLMIHMSKICQEYQIKPTKILVSTPHIKSGNIKRDKHFYKQFIVFEFHDIEKATIDNIIKQEYLPEYQYTFFIEKTESNVLDLSYEFNKIFDLVKSGEIDPDEVM